MKKTFKIKSTAIALMLTLIISVLSLVSCGSGSNNLYEWDISDDESMIWNEDREYSEYELPIGYKVAFTPTYRFDDDMSDFLDYYLIESYARDGQIISVGKNYEEDRYYTTEKGAKSIDALVNGSYSGIKLYRGGRASEIDGDLLDKLDNLTVSGGVSTEVDVSELRDVMCYDIRAYDSTGSVYYVHGAIYQYDGTEWYICYDRLANNYFDADGDFSYRRGTVEMYAIGNGILHTEIVEAMVNMTRVERSTIYEDEDVNPKAERPEREKMDPELRAKIWFWVVYFIIAFALPAWSLAVGFVNSRSPKHGRDKWWRMVSLGSLIWIIFGFAIMLILILG